MDWENRKGVSQLALSIYYVPGAVLNTEDTKKDKRQSMPLRNSQANRVKQTCIYKGLRKQRIDLKGINGRMGDNDQKGEFQSQEH